MTDSTLNIYERIAAVTEEIGSFPKDGKNTQFNFRYAGIEQIILTIQPVCIKHGICLIQEAVSTGVFENENKNGKVVLSCVDVLTHAINVDVPTDRVTTSTPAHGFDTLDKGIYKAISGGRKYAIFGMFNLMAGDEEPDADMGRGNEPPIPPVKRKAPARQVAGPAYQTYVDGPGGGTVMAGGPMDGPEYDGDAGGKSDHPTEKQQKMIFARFKKMGYSDDKRKQVIKALFKHTDSMKEITYDEGQALILWIENKEKELGVSN